MPSNTFGSSSSLIPISFYNAERDTISRKFAKYLIDAGWTIVCTRQTNKNLLELMDWCYINCDIADFGSNLLSHKFIFKNVGDAVMFKLVMFY